MPTIAPYCSKETLELVKKKAKKHGWTVGHYDREEFTSEDIVLFEAKKNSDNDARPALLKNILDHHPDKTKPKVFFLKDGKTTAADRKNFLETAGNPQGSHFKKKNTKQLLGELANM